MLVGYMRVSKADGSQNTDLQRDALLTAGIDPDAMYEDQASGKKDDRPHLAGCVKALREGDTLVVWKLDRLGRDLRHLVNIVHDLTQRGIGLKVLTGEGAAIDTTTASGKLVFGIFAALAEFERELIRERTLAGLADARARGRRGGRPYKMTGLDGPTRYNRRRPLQRTRRKSSDLISSCFAHRRATRRRAQSADAISKTKVTAPSDLTPRRHTEGSHNATSSVVRHTKRRFCIRTRIALYSQSPGRDPRSRVNRAGDFGH